MDRIMENIVETETINLDAIELKRLIVLADDARRAVKRMRIKISIIEYYGSWERFTEVMAEDGEIITSELSK